MRYACFFVLFIIAIHVTDLVTAESCPQGNCLAPNQCDDVLRGGQCTNAQHVCCSVVKAEYRTTCRHHGGECLDRCSKLLQRSTTDCKTGKVCCVLV